MEESNQTFRPQSRGPHQWWMITKHGKAAYMHYRWWGKQAGRDRKAGAGWKWWGGSGCHGGHRRTSSCNLLTPPPILEEVRRWYVDSPPTWPDWTVPSAHQLHWAIHSIHNWRGVQWLHLLLGHEGNPARWWFFVDGSIPETEPHGSVPRLHVTSPTCPQSCSGSNLACPCWQGLYFCHWQGCGKRACHQSSTEQWLPEVDCGSEPVQHIPPPTPPSQEQNQPKVVVILPYIRHLLESIRRILNPLGIRTCFRPYQTLRRTLVHLKDHIPLQQRSGVVYRIPCRTCTKVYIGQTGHTLEHRVKEHRRALVSGQSSLSAVAEHAMEEMHDIDWMGATVVDGHPHFHQRCALEAWHIRSQDSTMNRDAGPLPSVYNPLIHQPSPSWWLAPSHPTPTPTHPPLYCPQTKGIWFIVFYFHVSVTVIHFPPTHFLFLTAIGMGLHLFIY